MLGKKLAFRFSWAAQMLAFIRTCLAGLAAPHRKDVQATLQLGAAAVVVMWRELSVS